MQPVPEGAAGMSLRLMMTCAPGIPVCFTVQISLCRLSTGNGIRPSVCEQRLRVRLSGISARYSFIPDITGSHGQ
ncbi:hypothetical protein ACLB1N_19800 [Escherichia coli]